MTLGGSKQTNKKSVKKNKRRQVGTLREARSLTLARYLSEQPELYGSSKQYPYLERNLVPEDRCCYRKGILPVSRWVRFLQRNPKRANPAGSNQPGRCYGRPGPLSVGLYSLILYNNLLVGI